MKQNTQSFPLYVLSHALKYSLVVAGGNLGGVLMWTFPNIVLFSHLSHVDRVRRRLALVLNQIDCSSPAMYCHPVTFFDIWVLHAECVTGVKSNSVKGGC